MGRGVMPAAEEPQVRQVGLAAVGPVDDVVGFAPAGGDVTSRVGAVGVSEFQRSAEGLGDDPGGSSHLDGNRLGVEQDPADRGVAGQAPCGLGRDWPQLGVDDPVAVLEGAPGDGDQYPGGSARAVPALEVAAADFDEGIGASKKPEVRYFHIHEGDRLDEAQLAAWVKQASELPGAQWF